MPAPIRDIHVPAAGRVQLDWTDDPTTGATSYSVTAPRVTGAFVVSACYLYADDLDVDSGGIRVEFGEPLPGRSRAYDYHDRHDYPIINGVTLTNATHVPVPTMRTRRLTRHDVGIWRPTGRFTSCPAPDRTADRAAAILEALATHWLTRPDTYPLRLVSLHVEAERRRAGIIRDLDQERAELADQCAKIRQTRRALAAADALIAARLPATIPR